ncbi:glutamate racemase [Cyanobium sp. Morenito 9A2]|uniref:glutamate racemase n=1 Tax=Cyanobium sp. Morenito 9A2 TaxID=2823718 RepID=UPI0020CDF6DC|nr:glutamate racemase [Cyanobium sp. Morenito 9A2]MCP9849439.1 glutamate racemase [Cyanobium sp. Morenito 9A2]
MSLLLGLFDSGLGGLTVLKQLLARHPEQRFLYLGDTARVPYGQRSPAEIRAIASEVVAWLRAEGVDALLMACNTSNALAFDVALHQAGVPVYGLIDSVATQLRSKRVGVLATPATAASGAYGRAIRDHQEGALVVEVPCPEFVPLIEAGDLRDLRLYKAAQAYLQPLLEARVEAIVLGCTHYPLLRPLLRQLVPQEVLLVDPAVAAVARLQMLLDGQGQDPDDRPELEPLERGRFCVTGCAESFATSATPWLGQRPSVEQVSLQSLSRAF